MDSVANIRRRKFAFHRRITRLQIQTLTSIGANRGRPAVPRNTACLPRSPLSRAKSRLPGAAKYRPKSGAGRSPHCLFQGSRPNSRTLPGQIDPAFTRPRASRKPYSLSQGGPRGEETPMPGSARLCRGLLSPPRTGVLFLASGPNELSKTSR